MKKKLKKKQLPWRKIWKEFDEKVIHLEAEWEKQERIIATLVEKERGGKRLPWRALWNDFNKWYDDLLPLSCEWEPQRREIVFLVSKYRKIVEKKERNHATE